MAILATLNSTRRSLSVRESTFVIDAMFAQHTFNVGPGEIPLRVANILLTPQADVAEVAAKVSDLAKDS
jgi:hypothetical protein